MVLNDLDLSDFRRYRQQIATLTAEHDAAVREAGRYKRALENIRGNVESLAGGTVPGISSSAAWYFQMIQAICNAALAEQAGGQETGEGA